ncbi:MAG: hypothetical protein U9O41_01425 [Candidatus Aerophobetes bacterium]|nr:hypothetical protein [Candidatus Aerophobetes bacterium]
MKKRKLLTAVLLGVSLCFAPVLGYGEVKEWMYEAKANYMEVMLLKARVDYMMRNPDTFLSVGFYYDPDGRYKESFRRVDTKGKICLDIFDTRNRSSYKSGITLLGEFKKTLEAIYSFIKVYATDMDTDIVALFFSEEGIPLGYFYQGEYHLWEK